MADQEENSNINITKHYTYNVHSQSVQIGDGNKLQTTCETDGMGNIEYDVEQLKVTVATQGQKLENLTGQLENQAAQLNMQAGQLNEQAAQLNTQTGQLNAQAAQLNTQAGQLNAQAEQLKVHDSIFKQQPANQHIHSQRIENNCSITLRVVNRFGGKVEELQVNKNITVRELEVKIQQQFDDCGVIVITSNKDGVVYNGKTRDVNSRTRTLSSLGLEDGDGIYYL